MARRSTAVCLATGLLLLGSLEVRTVSADDADAVVEASEASTISTSPMPLGHVPGSTYGWRTSPRTGRRTFHAGLDFLAPRGTTVRAVAAGVVERVTRNRRGRTRFGGYGRAIVIRHPGAGVWTFYAHLDSVDVAVGDEVRAGTPIGAVGSSTNHRYRVPTHLHFEVRRAAHGGRSPFPGRYRRFNLDPRAWLRARGVRFRPPDDDAA